MSFNRNLIPDTHYEQQIQKEVGQEQIKLVSKRRFYSILEHAEDKYKKSKGFDPNATNRTFKNKIIPQLFEENPTRTHTFRTNNKIGIYADYANYFMNEGIHYLEFVLNTEIHPIVKNMDFSNLNYFEAAITETAKTYSYNITSYLGGRKINEFEIGLIYECVIDKDGVYDFDLDDTERILTKKDFPPKNTYYLGGI